MFSHTCNTYAVFVLNLRILTKVCSNKMCPASYIRHVDDLKKKVLQQLFIVVTLSNINCIYQKWVIYLCNKISRFLWDKGFKNKCV